MKSYKEFPKSFIGYSDIASLIMAGYKEGQGVVTEKLNFGEDGSYKAYIVNGKDVAVGSHYKKVAEFDGWLKIYDDDGLAIKYKANKIIVYRAGEMGCIVQLIWRKTNMKKIYYLRTNGYDMVVSVDENKNCRYLKETEDFPVYAENEEAIAFLDSVEDDSGWEDDCEYEEIFTEDVEIIAEIEKEL